MLQQLTERQKGVDLLTVVLGVIVSIPPNDLMFLKGNLLNSS